MEPLCVFIYLYAKYGKSFPCSKAEIEAWLFGPMQRSLGFWQHADNVVQFPFIKTV